MWKTPLVNLLNRNLENDEAPSSELYAHFDDRINDISFYTDEGWPQFGDRQQYYFGNNDGLPKFGGDNDDHLYGRGGDDTLSGLDGNDYLEGGTGSDTLIGGNGVDILVGGSEVDTYRISTSLTGSSDIIRDDDGVLLVDGTALSATITQHPPGSGTYYELDDDGNPVNDRVYIFGDDGLLIYFDAERTQSVWIENWTNGTFGITMETVGAPTMTPPDFSTHYDTSNYSWDTIPELSGEIHEPVVPIAGDFTDYREYYDDGYTASSDEKESTARAYIYYIAQKGLFNDSSIYHASRFFGSEGEHYYDAFPLVDDARYDEIYAEYGHGLLGYQFDGSPLDDVLYGSTYRDQIDAGPGDDFVAADGIDERINGDADVVNGGFGSDTIFGGGGNDSLSGGIVDISASHPYIDRTEGLLENSNDTDYLSGDAGNDTLGGSGAKDIILGGVGNDFIEGGMNQDTLSGGDEDDFIFGDTSRITQYQTYISEVEPGVFHEFVSIEEHFYYATSTQFEELNHLSNNDIIDGGDGFDVVIGELGNDLVNGGAGDDVIIGDRFTYSFNVPHTIAPEDGILELAVEEHGNDILHGGQDDDTVFGNGGSDTLFGEQGNDELWGDDHELVLQDDSVLLAHGDDLLFGGDGNNVLLLAA